MTLIEAGKAVKEFNMANPIGTPVRWRIKQNACPLTTRTTSNAFIWTDNVPAIYVHSYAFPLPLSLIETLKNLNDGKNTF